MYNYLKKPYEEINSKKSTSIIIGLFVAFLVIGVLGYWWYGSVTLSEVYGKPIDKIYRGTARDEFYEASYTYNLKAGTKIVLHLLDILNRWDHYYIVTIWDVETNDWVEELTFSSTENTNTRKLNYVISKAGKYQIVIEARQCKWSLKIYQ